MSLTQPSEVRIIAWCPDDPTGQRNAGSAKKREAEASRRLVPLLAHDLPDHAEAEASASADDVERHLGKAGKTERMRAGRRQVDHAAADERPAIVDAHHHRTAGAVIGDPHHG